ncbi:hypothetical protein Emed_003460 [Eimeria media]
MGIEAAAAAAAEGCLPRLDALSRVVFVPVSSVSAFRSGGSQSFSPLFCHHFFPADEKIVGFDSILIKLFFIPTTFDLYVHLDGVRTAVAATPAAALAAVLAAAAARIAALAAAGGAGLSEAAPAADLRNLPSAKFRPPGRVRSQTVLQQINNSSSGSSSGSKLLLQIRECVFSATESGKEFAALHRRVEWFLHWFIESASSIHPDPQWLVLLPYLCYVPAGGPNGGSQGGPEGALEWGLLDKAKERVREMRSRAEPSGCMVGPPLTAEDSEDRGPFSALPVFAAYPEASAAVAADDAAAAAEAAAGGPPPRSNAHKKAGTGGRGAKRERGGGPSAAGAAAGAAATASAKEEPAAPAAAAAAAEDVVAAAKGGGEAEGFYELAGLVTLYTFYGLNGYRRRLSQCLVFPHVQSKADAASSAALRGAAATAKSGSSNTTLSLTHKSSRFAAVAAAAGVVAAAVAALLHSSACLLLRSSVLLLLLLLLLLQFTVEDPATSFSQLRDVVCLKLAVDLGIVSSQMLYPPPAVDDEAPKGSTAPAAAAAATAASVAVSPAQPQAAASKDAAAAGHSADPGSPCPECLRRLLKETKLQAIRLSEILALAAVLPADTPQPPLDTPVFSSRRDWRQSDLSPPTTDSSSQQQQQQQQQQQEQQQGEETPAGQGLGGALKRPSAAGAAASKPSPAKRAGAPPSSSGFHEGPACAAVRLQVKRRLKRENHEVLSELPLQQQKAELGKRWAETYARYYRTIVKLRRLTAARPPAVSEETKEERPRRRQRRGSISNT